MDIKRQVGLNVLRIRRERGWSQEALAFEAEIHRTYVSGVERGVRNPTITVLAELAAALKVPPHQLLERVIEERGRPKKRPYARQRQ
jgi:transcriptional regulator with XRE-family HTH domain